MELLQLSTNWCAPCKAAKEYITSNFDVELLNYSYIALDNLEEIPENHINVIKELKPKSVPMFVVLGDGQIVYTFTGFDKVEIDKYAAFVKKQSATKIKDSISLLNSEPIINTVSFDSDFDLDDEDEMEY